MSKNSGYSKPLKGTIFDTIDVGTISATDLKLSPAALGTLLQGAFLDNVIITNSEISNSIIGANGNNSAFFTQLTTTNDVTFLGTSPESVYWDSNAGILNVTGAFNLNGCATISNISICQNTISAINNNGNVIIRPNNLGNIQLLGPITNVISSQGSFLSSIADGNFTVNASDFIRLNSAESGVTIGSAKSQNYQTLNGDITLRTDVSATPKNISSITQDINAFINIETVVNSNLNVNDIINITGSNSIPTFNGIYTVQSVIDSKNFIINATAGSFTAGNAAGTLLKNTSNNINLNSRNFVTIPKNIPLAFGNHTSASNLNSILGNTTGMYINSQGDISLNISSNNSVIIPGISKLELGESYLNYGVSPDTAHLNSLNLVSNNVSISGSQSNILTANTRFYDPNPIIGYTSNTSGSNYDGLNTAGDLSDRGIAFNYYTAGSLKLGWFGYKTDKGQFVFLTDATNTNEVMTGTLGNFNISSISADTITINGILNMACSPINNVSLITGCNGTVNILGTSGVNISTGGVLALRAGIEINMQDNIPLNFGTNGNIGILSSLGNLTISGGNSINLVARNSVVIPKNIFLNMGSSSVISDTFSNLFINSGNMYLGVSAGNIYTPNNSNILFGTTGTQLITGNTGGMTIQGTTVNLVSNSSVNISSSLGNIVVASGTNGSINLLSNTTRIPTNSYLVFSTNGTSGSIINSVGNIIINGATSGSIILQNTETVSLSTANINIPNNTLINVGSSVITSSSGTLITSSGNYIVASNSITMTSKELIITNITTNNISIITNITSQNYTINGTVANLNTRNLNILDPNVLINSTAMVNVDSGIEFNYTTTSGTSLGWFGYKSTTGIFTFLTNASDNNNIITGTPGQFQLGSALIANSIVFNGTAGTPLLDMSCGTIANVNTITGCGGIVNILAPNTINASASNINLLSNNVRIPNGTPLTFGSIGNSIFTNSIGNMTISVLNGGGTLILNSNVQINGTTQNVYSTVTNIQDPILSIGGVIGPSVQDTFDRGIEFKWNNGVSRTGFFGFSNALNAFQFIPIGTNTNEIYTGSYGNCYFANGNFNNLEVNCGTISNVRTITGCNGTELTISSTNTILSSGNVLLPQNTTISFGTVGSIVSNSTNGSINITSQTGGINLVSTAVTINSTLNIGTSSIVSTGGNLNITNTNGNILLTPQSGTTGNVYIPLNNNLSFGGTAITGGSTNYITSNGQELNLYGYSGIAINSSTVTISGNLNIIGSISASAVQSNPNEYILPLGTSQILNITNISNTTTIGSTAITSSIVNNLSIGDSVQIKNTDSTPIIDGTYIVTSIINGTRFTISSGALSAPGTTGTIISNLTVYQGKDVGVQVQYWSTVGNTSVTAGSGNYRTGFFGWISNTQQWTFFNQATISNNVVTGGVPGDIRINTLFANSIDGTTGSSITLNTTLTGGNIYPSYIQINNGLIDNTPIGQTIARSGRFTNLGSTISANLTNLTLSSTVNYSIDRYTCNLGNLNQNPRTDTIVSFITLSGTNVNSSGTMGNTGIADGQLKKIIMSGVSTGNIYTLHFGAGKLITPNALGGIPTKIQFKRQGQSCELIYDLVTNAWILSNPGSCYVL